MNQTIKHVLVCSSGCVLIISDLQYFKSEIITKWLDSKVAHRKSEIICFS